MSNNQEHIAVPITKEEAAVAIGLLTTALYMMDPSLPVTHQGMQCIAATQKATRVLQGLDDKQFADVLTVGLIKKLENIL